MLEANTNRLILLQDLDECEFDTLEQRECRGDRIDIVKCAVQNRD